ncbi:MAG: nitric oxide dioxygenase, partial [Tolumonas sp.]|nr:nitric oxide dioxygenase [Tolumonas sp.]
SMPLGDFFLNETVQTPVVLLSGGVGITPMVSIINHLIATQSARKVHFIHTCRNNAVHAFKSHVEQLAAAQTNVEASFFYDQRTEQDSGIGAAPLAVDHLLSPELADAEYYLCGPAPFMRHYLSELQQNGVTSERIFAEAFGSGGVN